MANNASEFAKLKANTPPMKSTATSAPKESGKSRGVEHPVSTDAALIGDTRHELHSKALPKLMGPNFGYGKEAPTDQFRVDCGEGAAYDL